MRKIRTKDIIVTTCLFAVVAGIVLGLSFLYGQAQKSASTVGTSESVQARPTNNENTGNTGANDASPVAIEEVVPKKPMKLLFLGDTMVGRSIGDQIVAGEDPLVNVKGEFKNYDYVVANLETNISTPGVGTKAAGKLYTFNAPVPTVNYLKGVGINVANLANNHTMDYGPHGLIDQIELLNETEVETFGAGENTEDAFKPLLLEKDGVRVAIIGVNDIETWLTKVQDDKPGSAYLSESLIQEAITSARDDIKADFVIIEVHWGFEYKLAYAASQEQWGHKFIDMGADLVVGMHPHVQQDSVVYKGKTIFYSLGNFLFDVMQDYETSRGYVVEVEVAPDPVDSSKRVLSTSVKYVLLDANGWPSWVE